MKKLTYKIYSLGCKVNQYDSDSLGARLQQAGLSLDSKNADIAVVNSCAVTKTAISKAGSMINKARKENPRAKIILIGCWPQVYNTQADDIGVNRIYGVNKVEEIIKDLGIVRDSGPLGCENKIVATDKARYTIKIQDGCEQYCSYCIIPYTRGKLKSRNEEAILREIKEAVSKNYREIVLSGIHLGLYGKESANINLATLIKKIVKLKDLGRLRLSSIEITDITDELIELIASSKKICNHLHVPLQSGSDKILKLMNRPYDTVFFNKKIIKIRKKIPNIAITTDVIVGFPGETEKDFQATYNFIKHIKFSRLHVFPFSVHEKTPAAKMPGRIEKKVKTERAKILRVLGRRLAGDFKNKFKNQKLNIIIEKIKEGYLTGKSEYYFDREIESKLNEEGVEALIGKIVKG